MKTLFFVALVLPDEIARPVQAIKQEFSDRFGTRHGLHTVPHITIIPPFPAEQSGIADLIPRLSAVAGEQKPFDITLEDFDCFAKDVLFVSVVKSQALENLHQAFQAVDGREPRNFHPHVTIAHRDVKPAMMAEVRSDYEKRKFKAVYTAASISLLKLEDGRWKIFEEFPFGN